MITEELLTSLLFKNLEHSEIKKITNNKSASEVSLFREIGNESYVADIFISVSKNKKVTRFNTKEVQFIAIEVKIKDWKQGLYQAWRYSSFAEKSYLAIYEKYSKNIDVELFRRYNVGLIIFNESEVKVLNSPKQKSFSLKSNSLLLRKSMWEKTELSIKTV